MWNAVLNSEIQVQKPITQKLMQKIKDNLDYLYGKTTFDAGLLNGSFEIDSDNDGVPDNWTVSLFAGGQPGYEITNPAHGRLSYKFIHPGGANNGGGYIESDYLEVSQVNIYVLSIIMWSSVAGVKNLIHARYFDKNKNYIGTDESTLYATNVVNNELIYNSTSNPISPKNISGYFIPPAGARYVKVRLIAGYTDTNVAGTTYFDNVVLDQNMNLPTLGIIAEASTLLTSWQTVGTVTLKVPSITNGFLRLDFDAEVKTYPDNSDVAYIRFYVDSNYSSFEYGTSLTNYALVPIRVLVPYTAIVNGEITLTMQLMSKIGNTAYGKKAIAETLVTIYPA